jgi:hypothetical protein
MDQPDVRPPAIAPGSPGLGLPSRPPFAFRVGFIGHRPERLQEANRDALSTALGTILREVSAEVRAVHAELREHFADAAPVLRAVTSLAEGADRLFAEEALAVGCDLSCILPFPQREFERDFDGLNALEPDSVARFRELLGQARGARFELDGVRADLGGAYRTCGRVVLNHSDLLVVVWDGRQERRVGGTDDALEAAQRRGTPVVWVDAEFPHLWRVLGLGDVRAAEPGNESAAQAIDGLREVVRGALELPLPEVGAGVHGPRHAVLARTWVGRLKEQRLLRREAPGRLLAQFYEERQPQRSFALVWKVFREVVSGRIPHIQVAVEPFEGAVHAEWTAPEMSPLRNFVERLRPFFAWPDQLAVLYANRYRSAFVLAYLLAAAAVFLALLPVGAQLLPHGAGEAACTVLEVAVILVILGLVLIGSFGRWHARWLDYRLISELVRHIRLVTPLGGGRPFPQIPPHWASYGEPSTSWMAWYVRAVERSVDLPTAVVDRAYVGACLTDLAAQIERQVAFHASIADSSHRIEARLHGTGVILLAVTLVACVWHLPQAWTGLPAHVLPSSLLTFLCGFLPATGAALAGIVNQGEFRRIAKRSKAMSDLLIALRRAVERLLDRIGSATSEDKTQFSVEAAELAADAAGKMVSEVLDWRVVFLDRPLMPPA